VERKKARLRELITKAKKGDHDAVLQIVHQFIPAVKKHGRRMGYEEAYADLIIWIVNAIQQYEPINNYDKNEFNNCS